MANACVLQAFLQRSQIWACMVQLPRRNAESKSGNLNFLQATLTSIFTCIHYTCFDLGQKKLVTLQKECLLLEVGVPSSFLRYFVTPLLSYSVTASGLRRGESHLRKFIIQLHSFLVVSNCRKFTL